MAHMSQADRQAWMDKNERLNQGVLLCLGMEVKDGWGNRGVVVKIVRWEGEPSVDNHGMVLVWQSERTTYGGDNCARYPFLGWQRLLRILPPEDEVVAQEGTIQEASPPVGATSAGIDTKEAETDPRGIPASVLTLPDRWAREAQRFQERNPAWAQQLRACAKQLQAALVSALPEEDAIREAPKHLATLHELLLCFRAWEDGVRVLGNVRADDAACAIVAAQQVLMLASPQTVEEATGVTALVTQQKALEQTLLTLKAAGIDYSSFALASAHAQAAAQEAVRRSREIVESLGEVANDMLRQRKQASPAA